MGADEGHGDAVPKSYLKNFQNAAALEDAMRRMLPRELADQHYLQRLNERKNATDGIEAQIREAKDLAWACGADEVVK